MKALATPEELIARQKVFVERRKKLKEAFQMQLVAKPSAEQVITYKRLNRLASECSYMINKINRQLGVKVPRFNKRGKKKREYPVVITKADKKLVFDKDHLKLNGNYFVRELEMDELYSTYKDHHRLIVFAQKGLKCSVEGCPRVGVRLIECIDTQGGLHVDVFTNDLHLMTVDHIHPKSKGGSEILENKQPMCQSHNTKKSDKIL